MTVLICLLLMACTGGLAFQLGRRFEVGAREREAASYAASRERGGRRGTMTLRPMKIRR